jgi:hypothetical protein
VILGPQGLSRGVSGVTAFNRVSKSRIARLEPLTEECIDYLMSVVRDVGADTKHRVTAAKCVLEEHRWIADKAVKNPAMETLTETQARALLACDPVLARMARENADAAAIVAESYNDEA